MYDLTKIILNKSVGNITFATMLLFTLLLIWATNTQASPMTNSLPYVISTQPALIGKVFDDKDGDGYQDSNEDGIAGIRLATVAGLVIITDGNGRYHVPDAYGVTQSWGRNFVIKLDLASLPQGSVITTENPRVIRFSNSSLNKVNFGVQLP